MRFEVRTATESAGNLCTWASALQSAVERSVCAGRSWPDRRWDDLRLAALKLIFLIVSRAVPLLRLSHREAWWNDAEILMLPPACCRRA
jgi:hypothetical protein